MYDITNRRALSPSSLTNGNVIVKFGGKYRQNAVNLTSDPHQRLAFSGTWPQSRYR